MTNATSKPGPKGKPGCSTSRISLTPPLAGERNINSVRRHGHGRVEALETKLGRRGPAVADRLVDHAEQGAGLVQRLAEALLLAVEGIEAAAQQEGQLIEEHRAG